MVLTMHVRSVLATATILSLSISASMAQFTQVGSKLVGSGAAGFSEQGTGAALSGDGNTAIVGGPYDDGTAGAAWIFTRTDDGWKQQGIKLVAADTAGPGRQGYSVSISADGNTAIVGGALDSGSVGAAWIFTRSGGVWFQQGSKLVGTGAVGTSYQGVSVSISSDGNTAIVGGHGDDGNIGAAWIFIRSGGVWTQQGSKLVGTGAVGPAAQGLSVSISSDGNTAAVGGYTDNSATGAVWVYTRSGGVWSQQGGKLVGTGGVGGSNQGGSVSISADGNTIIAGGIGDDGGVGAAWVYTRSGGVWSQQGVKLVGTGGVGGSNQGRSVSISADGNQAIVGGPSDNFAAGAAWMFTRSGGVWTQKGSKLVGTGGASNANQGASVSISADGKTAIVGGPIDLGIGASWVYYDLPDKPSITSVADIPNDQGSQVRVSWTRSPYDDSLFSPQVTTYHLFRLSPAGTAIAGKARPLPAWVMTDSSLSGYDYIGEVPALQQPEYQLVVPTLEDSSSSGIPYFRFRVVASTPDVSLHYISEADSGYSVDNLSPIPPAGLVATVEPGPQVGLEWDSPTDADVREYRIHRSTSSGFIPGVANNIGSAAGTNYTDTSPAAGVPNYYRIIAVDIHDNESAPSDEAGTSVLATSQFSVQEKWNIVSVPLRMSDYARTVLFPTATSSAFTFEDGYVAYATLENGRGYWMKFSGGETISHSGLWRMEDTIAIAAGWNMVGSLSVPLSAADVGSIPGGIVTSGFYQYDNGYTSSSTLEPGRGYWVKASQAGLLVLSATSASPASNRIRIEDRGELPPLPPGQPDGVVPDEYSLDQNYPNPFNPTTTIRYVMPTGGHVTISVFNMLGQEVAVLVDEVQEPGVRSVNFDAGRLPSGIYTCKITAGAYNAARRMMLLK